MMFSALFGSLKAKLYAIGTVIAISYFSYIKWKLASVDELEKKVTKLKREAVVAKKVSQHKADSVEYRGWQEAIDVHLNEIELETALEVKRRKEDVSNDDPDYTTVTL